MKFSTGLVHKMLGNYADTGDGLGGALGGFVVRYYAGAVPATADAAATGTLVATLTVGNDGATGATWAAPSAGTVSRLMSENLWGECVASGTITYKRVQLLGDAGSLSTTAPRLQMTCGLQGSGADDIRGRTAYASGEPISEGTLKLDLNAQAGRWSTALRTKMLGSGAAGTGDGLSGLLDGFVVDFFQGARPVYADNAPGVSPLITFTLNGLGAAGSGFLAPSARAVRRDMNDLLLGTGLAKGTATWLRLRKTTDLGTTNTTDIRVDFTLGTGAADIFVSNPAIVDGEVQNFGSVIIRSLGWAA